jgi:hypothetical protein
MTIMKFYRLYVLSLNYSVNRARRHASSARNTFFLIDYIFVGACGNAVNRAVTLTSSARNTVIINHICH